RPEPIGEEVAPGEHGEDAGDCRRGRDIDSADTRMSVGGAHHYGMGLSGQADVVGVAALAGDEAQVLLAADGVSDAGACRFISHAALPLISASRLSHSN